MNINHKLAERTICPYLWQGIYINKDGCVYSCCLNKPHILGNINSTHLRDICNNDIIKAFRKKSLSGRLPCFNTCFLLHKEKSHPVPGALTIQYSSLKRIKILFGEACNIHCVMCRQSQKSKQTLKAKTLINNIDFYPFSSIEIQGGEPLYMEESRAFFDYVTQIKNKKVSIMTNGLLIDKLWAQKIALYADFIYFSLNAATKAKHELINKGSSWETVLGNIKKVKFFKKRYDSPVRIWGHMTIIKDNLKEIPLFIKKYKELGFEEIDFGFDKSIPGYLNILPPAVIKEFRNSIKNALTRNPQTRNIDIHALELLKLI